MIRAILLSSAFLGAFLSTGAAGLFLIQEADTPVSNIFPMPFLVLAEWAALGIAGAVYIILTELQSDPGKVRGAWAISGAFIPLILLGAFSIGPLALVSAVLLLVPTLIVTLRNHMPITQPLVIFGVGAIANLVLLYAFIILAGVS